MCGPILILACVEGVPSFGQALSDQPLALPGQTDIIGDSGGRRDGVSFRFSMLDVGCGESRVDESGGRNQQKQLDRTHFCILCHGNSGQLRWIDLIDLCGIRCRSNKNTNTWAKKRSQSLWLIEFFEVGDTLDKQGAGGTVLLQQLLKRKR
jgi:hypothetical protein